MSANPLLLNCKKKLKKGLLEQLSQQSAIHTFCKRSISQNKMVPVHTYRNTPDKNSLKESQVRVLLAMLPSDDNSH